MSLTGLVYLSEASSSLTESELAQILEKAEVRNKQLEITGYLCRFKNRILQYIEGPEEQLGPLFNKIKADKRHKILFHTLSPKFTKRRFPNWGMRMISNDELNRFNIELLLENNLLYLKSDLPNPEAIEGNIWSQIDSLARQQGELSPL